MINYLFGDPMNELKGAYRRLNLVAVGRECGRDGVTIGKEA
jgi:hypothetical protein